MRALRQATCGAWLIGTLLVIVGAQAIAGETERSVLALFFGDPPTGHRLRRATGPSCLPALVVSNDLFNRHTGLCIASPITSTRRGYPFHVAIPPGEGVTGFVMVEQVESIDFRSRKAKRLGKASAGVLEEVLSILDACIY